MRLIILILLSGCGAVAKTSPNGGADGGGSCSVAQTECGGSCVDTNADDHNCGGCGVACGGATSCCQGACSTSCSLTVTGAEPATGWQNGGDYLTLRGAGFTRRMKVFIG